MWNRIVNVACIAGLVSNVYLAPYSPAFFCVCSILLSVGLVLRLRLRGVDNV